MYVLLSFHWFKPNVNELLEKLEDHSFRCPPSPSPSSVPNPHLLSHSLHSLHLLSTQLLLPTHPLLSASSSGRMTGALVVIDMKREGRSEELRDHRQPPPGPHAAHTRTTFARMIGGITRVRRSIARPTARRRGKDQKKNIYRRADRIEDLHLNPACATCAAAGSAARPGGAAGAGAGRAGSAPSSTPSRQHARRAPARLAPRRGPGKACT